MTPSLARIVAITIVILVLGITRYPTYRNTGNHRTGSRSGLCVTAPNASVDFDKLNSSRLKRKVVFLIGQGRSGSTLIGDIFNHMENAVYLFEPLRAVDSLFPVSNFRNKDELVRTRYNEVVERLLSQISTCQFRNSSNVYLKNFDVAGFRYFSRALTGPPFCNNQSNACQEVTAPLMNRLCSDPHTVMVVKELTFRLPNSDLTFIEYLARKYEAEIDMHLLHLVRDPRAFLLSMRKLEWFTTEHDDPEKTEQIFVERRCHECNRNLQIYNHRARLPDYFHYYVLRYEDFAVSPLRILEKIFASLQIPLTAYLQSYVYNRTHAKEIADSDPYRTSARKSRAVVDKWRTESDLKFVFKVQRACHEVMKLLGYELVENERDLLDPNKPLAVTAKVRLL